MLRVSPIGSKAMGLESPQQLYHARPPCTTKPHGPFTTNNNNKHVVHCVFLPQAAKQLAWSCANMQLPAILWYVVCCMTRNMLFTVCFSCRQQSSWLGVAGQVDVGSSQAGTAGGWGLAQPHHAADGAAIGLLVARCSSATAVLMWVQCSCVENQCALREASFLTIFWTLKATNFLF